jgi:hypothetical protein
VGAISPLPLSASMACSGAAFFFLAVVNNRVWFFFAECGLQLLEREHGGRVSVVDIGVLKYILLLCPCWSVS